MLTQSRRTFTKNMVLGTTALALPLPPALLAKKGSDMKLGLVTYLWGKDWDVPTLIANCKKTKVLGVELRTQHAHGVDPDISKARRKEVQMQFADSPVELVGLGTNQDYHHADSAKLKASIEGTKAFIKLSHDVGGTGVKVKPNAFPEGVSKEKTIEQIGQSLREVGQFGADYGQEIRVEVHGRETQQLPNIRAMMDVADHPNVRVCWNCNQEDLIGEGLMYNFNLVKDYFGATAHVREFDVGDYPYEQLMALLVDMDYAGWILLECRTDPEDKVKALKEQRKLFKKLVKQGRK